jgi:hypothetical protein
MGSMGFEAEFMRRIDAAKEVEIETRRKAGTSRQTIVWVVVDGGHVYVRSVRGPAGKWYQRLLRDPDGAIHHAGIRTPVRAVPVSNASEIERVSEALQRKYARQRSSLASMLRPETLPTTMRLEPA